MFKEIKQKRQDNIETLTWLKQQEKPSMEVSMQRRMNFYNTAADVSFNEMNMDPDDFKFFKKCRLQPAKRLKYTYPIFLTLFYGISLAACIITTDKPLLYWFSAAIIAMYIGSVCSVPFIVKDDKKMIEICDNPGERVGLRKIVVRSNDVHTFFEYGEYTTYNSVYVGSRELNIVSQVPIATLRALLEANPFVEFYIYKIGKKNAVRLLYARGLKSLYAMG